MTAHSHGDRLTAERDSQSQVVQPKVFPESPGVDPPSDPPPSHHRSERNLDPSKTLRNIHFQKNMTLFLSEAKREGIKERNN